MLTIRHPPDFQRAGEALPLTIEVVFMAQAVALKPAVREVEFRLDGHRVPYARSVVLVGSFNRWDTSVHRLTLQPDQWWTITLTLGVGEYPYLFIVDGVPWNDPEDDRRIPSEWGGEYSVRLVR
jgi:1,4-alpha-glucan branching enzyme